MLDVKAGTELRWSCAVEDGCDLGAVGGMKSCLMLKLMLVLYFVVDRVRAAVDEDSSCWCVEDSSCVSCGATEMDDA